MTQQQSAPATLGAVIRIVVGLVTLALLALKGFGVGISWFTIVGVLAIPGVLATVAVGIIIPLLVLAGIASLASDK